MNIRDDDQVSAVALVAESEAQTGAAVVDDDVVANGVELDAPTAAGAESGLGPAADDEADGSSGGDGPGEADGPGDDE